MSIFYKSKRVGKNGKVFWMYKFKTLKNGSDKSQFADKQSYTRYGKFLRKYKIDELPQLINVVKGEMSLVGPRAEETRTVDILPEGVRNVILSVKPGITSLASIHFFDEEKLLQNFSNSLYAYWTAIKPMKILLDIFYIKNKSALLNLAIIWQTIKKIIIRR